MENCIGIPDVVHSHFPLPNNLKSQLGYAIKVDSKDKCTTWRPTKIESATLHENLNFYFITLEYVCILFNEGMEFVLLGSD